MGNFKLISFTLLINFALLFSSISSADTIVDSLNKDSQKYLSFYETIDGELIHWEANFDGNEIISIYRNGEKIPDDLVADYHGKVYRELDEMRPGGKFYSFRMPDLSGKDFNIDMDELHKNLEEFREKFKDHKWKLEEFKFDDEKLKQDMEELKEELKKHKFEKFQWNFDDEEFKERMKKLEEYLKEHLDDFKFEFDFDEGNNNAGEV
jgi:chromosome segregation ATPase